MEVVHCETDERDCQEENYCPQGADFPGGKVRCFISVKSTTIFLVQPIFEPLLVEVKHFLNSIKQIGQNLL